MADRPTRLTIIIASDWLAYAESSDAWDRMNDLVASKPDDAWRVIQAMVYYAPDHGILAAVATGPVDSLFHQDEDRFLPIFRDEAACSPRFRECLRATHIQWPPELKELLERDASVRRSRPEAGEIRFDVAPQEMQLVISWFHHSEASWASIVLNELMRTDPQPAWDVVRWLTAFADEGSAARDVVFIQAVMPFVRQNFAQYRDALLTLTRRHLSLHEWLAALRRSPIDDEEAWQAFIDEIAS